MYNLEFRTVDLKKWKIFSNFETTNHIVLAHIYGPACEGAIFITNYDEVYLIGDDSLGFFGPDYALNRDQPQKIEELSHQEIIGIRSGKAHWAAYNTRGDLYCWGDNSSGQLGDSKTAYRSRPSKLETEKHRVINAAAGSTFTLALTDNYEVLLWGVLGNNSKINLKSTEKIIYITSGWSHAVLLSENGQVFTWGTGENGQLGHGDKKSLDSPKKVEFTGSIIKVACGRNATIAVNELGEVYSWGDNTAGCLSVGNVSDNVSTPTKVLLREPVTDIAASIYHQIFAAGNEHTGHVFVWGSCKNKVSYLCPISAPSFNLFEAFCDLPSPITDRGFIGNEIQDVNNDNVSDNDFVSVKDLKITDVNLIVERCLPTEMFNNKEMSDVTIKLNGCDICAHKVILNYFSKHFRKMFQEEWKENSMDIIDMTNYNAVAYQSYIKFIYTGIMEELEALDMFDLYLIAREYREDRLAVECLRNLSLAVDVNNVANLFVSAWRNKCQEMIEMCVKESAKYFEEVVFTEGFKTCTTEELLQFCKLTSTERKNPLSN